MTAITQLYHNPRCSKSREALALLRERGIEPSIVLYLNDPPSIEELGTLAALLSVRPRELVRTGGPEYAELGLADPGRTDEELLAAIHAHPRLLQRPIFVHRGEAVIGRPPEQVLTLL